MSSSPKLDRESPVLVFLQNSPGWEILLLHPSSLKSKAPKFLFLNFTSKALPHAFEGWPCLVWAMSYQQWVQSYQFDKVADLKGTAVRLVSPCLLMMEVLYILSCCWISPDPDALFICYLKIRSYLPRHCLPPDTRGTGYLAKREAGIYHPVPAVAFHCATHRYLGLAQATQWSRPRCCACCLSFSSSHLLLLLLSPRS